MKEPASSTPICRGHCACGYRISPKVMSLGGGVGTQGPAAGGTLPGGGVCAGAASPARSNLINGAPAKLERSELSGENPASPGRAGSRVSSRRIHSAERVFIEGGPDANQRSVCGGETISLREDDAGPCGLRRCEAIKVYRPGTHRRWDAAEWRRPSRAIHLPERV